MQLNTTTQAKHRGHDNVMKLTFLKHTKPKYKVLRKKWWRVSKPSVANSLCEGHLVQSLPLSQDSKSVSHRYCYYTRHLIVYVTQQHFIYVDRMFIKTLIVSFLFVWFYDVLAGAVPINGTCPNIPSKSTFIATEVSWQFDIGHVFVIGTTCSNENIIDFTKMIIRYKISFINFSKIQQNKY